MQGSKAGKRYAKALFDLAREGGSLDQVRADLAGLTRLAGGSEEFQEFLFNPLVPANERFAALEKIAVNADPLTLKFLRFIDGKNRLDILEAIGTAFEELYCEDQGVLRVTVVSADPLTDPQLERLKDKLGKRHHMTIDITVDIDHSLIGGFKIKIGDTIDDYSITSQLQRFKRGALSA